MLVASGWLINNIANFLYDALSELIDKYVIEADNIFTAMTNATATFQAVENVVAFTTILSCFLVIFVTVKQYLTIYGFEIEGNPDREPMEIIVRSTICFAVISCNTWLYSTLLSWAGTLATDFLNSFTSTDPVAYFTGLSAILAATLILSASSAFIMIVVAGALVIGLLIFYFVAAKRAIELIFMKILFQIIAEELMTSNHAKFSNFFSHYLVTAVGYIFQLISLRFFFLFAVNMFITEADVAYIDVASMFLTFACLAMMIRAPRWLEQFVYSSGFSNAAQRSPGIIRTVKMVSKSS